MCIVVVCVYSCESTLNLFTDSETAISQSLYPNQNAVAAYHPPCHHSCLVQAPASVLGQSNWGMGAAANSLVKHRKEGLLLENSIPIPHTDARLLEEFGNLKSEMGCKAEPCLWT